LVIVSLNLILRRLPCSYNNPVKVLKF
jgi:hypothetical protein